MQALALADLCDPAAHAAALRAPYTLQRRKAQLRPGVGFGPHQHWQTRKSRGAPADYGHHSGKPADRSVLHWTEEHCLPFTKAGQPPSGPCFAAAHAPPKRWPNAPAERGDCAGQCHACRGHASCCNRSSSSCIPATANTGQYSGGLLGAGSARSGRAAGLRWTQVRSAVPYRGWSDHFM